jgi:predicted MFS family arabinose efflux permease
MLVASTLAGLLWEHHGAATTFYAGAAFSVLAAVLIVARRGFQLRRQT